MNKVTEYLILGLIVLLLGANVWAFWKIDRLKTEVLQAQLQQNNELRSRFEQYASAHRDSVLIIDHKLTVLNNQRHSDESTVVNTHDVDSLIALYYRHRADIAN